MFPFMFPGCCGMSSDPAATRQRAKTAQLEFLRWMRDGLEARLAAVNAAIATLEHQNSQSSET
jgi:hypothetical protein